MAQAKAKPVKANRKPDLFLVDIPVCVMSCTKPQYRKRLFETFHKKRHPFKEPKDVIVFSHFSLSFIALILVSMNCGCHVVNY